MNTLCFSPHGIMLKEVERILPRGYALEKALISLYGPDDSLKDTGYFHHFVTLDDIL